MCVTVAVRKRQSLTKQQPYQSYGCGEEMTCGESYAWDVLVPYIASLYCPTALGLSQEELG